MTRILLRRMNGAAKYEKREMKHVEGWGSRRRVCAIRKTTQRVKKKNKLTIIDLYGYNFVRQFLRLNKFYVTPNTSTTQQQGRGRHRLTCSDFSGKQEEVSQEDVVSERLVSGAYAEGTQYQKVHKFPSIKVLCLQNDFLFFGKRALPGPTHRSSALRRSLDPL